MLQVWIPGIENLNNQGLLQLPSPSYNSMIQNSSGKIGKCYKGMLEYHLSNDPLTTNQVSVACWIKGDSFNPYNNIIFCANTSDSEDSKYYFSIINNTTLNFGINSSGTYSISYTFATDTWYHIAATYDGDKIRLYVNGELKGTSNSLNIIPRTVLNYGIMCRSYNLTGTSVSGWSQYYNDFRLFNSCLSPKQIHEIAKGLVLHYPLNDQYVQTTVYDCSGYCNNGTVIGSLQVADDSPKYKKSTKITTSNTIKTIVPVLNNIYSFSWWYNKADFAVGDMMWGYADGNRINPLYYLCFNIGDGTGSPWYVPGTTTKITAPSGNTWHHFVITGDGSTSTLYVDGNRYGTCINFKPITGSILHINGWNSEGDYRTNGKISDFRIYSTVISEDDIKELYNTSAIINNNNTLEAYEFSEADTYSINKSGVIEGSEFIEQDGEVQINNTEQVFATEFTEI